MLFINDDLSIPEDELVFKASRSGGPGGQHVNKVSSRVTLYFDLEASPALAAAQKGRIRRRLATRISKSGLLRVISRKHRSQAANRAVALERFAELLRDALKRETPRKKTRVPRAEKRRRLEQKKQRARLKERRAKPGVRYRET
jgi:ribosome-associated protein